MDQPTLVALSSGGLPSGVALIRLSGPKAFAAVERLCGDLPAPRRAVLREIRNPQSSEHLDTGLVLIFPAPNSFTGLDCAELQVHGSPAGVKAILSALTAMDGIELAGPGDFTRLAFENGKLDLTAVEGLGDLLAAETEGQRRQALARLEGNFSHRIAGWREKLLDARAEIEARLDFSDEDDVPFELPQNFASDLARLQADLEDTLAEFTRGRITREGFRIVLAGHPNAGKSSLLNALAGSDIAIVTPEAGTTRDTKDVAIDLDGTLAILTDTAGLRETESLAEREGVARAKKAMNDADLVLWLSAPDIDDDQTPPQTQTPLWRVASKSDMTQYPDPGAIPVSTRSLDGTSDLISRLQTHIRERLGSDEPALVSRLRDRKALEAAIECIAAAQAHLDRPELCGEDLRQAGDALAGLIGLMDSEHVLGRLFAGFCIGK